MRKASEMFKMCWLKKTFTFGTPYYLVTPWKTIKGRRNSPIIYINYFYRKKNPYLTWSECLCLDVNDSRKKKRWRITDSIPTGGSSVTTFIFNLWLSESGSRRASLRLELRRTPVQAQHREKVKLRANAFCQVTTPGRQNNCGSKRDMPGDAVGMEMSPTTLSEVLVSWGGEGV